MPFHRAADAESARLRRCERRASSPGRAVKHRRLARSPPPSLGKVLGRFAASRCRHQVAGQRPARQLAGDPLPADLLHGVGEVARRVGAQHECALPRPRRLLRRHRRRLHRQPRLGACEQRGLAGGGREEEGEEGEGEGAPDPLTLHTAPPAPLPQALLAEARGEDVNLLLPAASALIAIPSLIVIFYGARAPTPPEPRTPAHLRVETPCTHTSTPPSKRQHADALARATWTPPRPLSRQDSRSRQSRRPPPRRASRSRRGDHEEAAGGGCESLLVSRNSACGGCQTPS